MNAGADTAGAAFYRMNINLNVRGFKYGPKHPTPPSHNYQQMIPRQHKSSEIKKKFPSFCYTEFFASVKG